MRAIQPATHAICVAPPKAMQTNNGNPNRTQRKRQQRNRRIAIIGSAAMMAGLIFVPKVETGKPISEFNSVVTSEVVSASISSTETPELFKPNLLSSISMDYDTQYRIFTEACGSNTELFASVMAIATTESGINPNAVGDSGTSFGMMQINTDWQKERIHNLGITDLMDPVQNVMVAVDYIEWIVEHIDSGRNSYCSNELYMVYNMGLRGYRKAVASGKTSTEYSRATVVAYNAYLQEIYGGIVE